MANGRCRMHGGKSLKGIAHPRFKGTLKTILKVLPKEMRRDFSEAVRDPDLISLRGELGLLQTRLAQTVRCLGDNHPPDWPGFMKAVEDLWVAWTNPQRDLDAIGGMIGALTDLVRAGLDAETNQRRAWVEVRQLAQERRRVVTAETRRTKEAQQSIRKEQALALFMAVANSFRARILDADLYAKGPRAVLSAVQADVDRMLILAEEQQPFEVEALPAPQGNNGNGDEATQAPRPASE
jgi:hypothetical protein